MKHTVGVLPCTQSPQRPRRTPQQFSSSLEVVSPLPFPPQNFFSSSAQLEPTTSSLCFSMSIFWLFPCSFWSSSWPNKYLYIARWKQKSKQLVTLILVQLSS